MYVYKPHIHVYKPDINSQGNEIKTTLDIEKRLYMPNEALDEPF